MSHTQHLGTPSATGVQGHPWEVAPSTAHRDKLVSLKVS